MEVCRLEVGKYVGSYQLNPKFIVKQRGIDYVRH